MHTHTHTSIVMIWKVAADVNFEHNNLVHEHTKGSPVI